MRIVGAGRPADGAGAYSPGCIHKLDIHSAWRAGVVTPYRGEGFMHAYLLLLPYLPMEVTERIRQGTYSINESAVHGLPTCQHSAHVIGSIITTVHHFSQLFPGNV